MLMYEVNVKQNLLKMSPLVLLEILEGVLFGFDNI